MEHELLDAVKTLSHAAKVKIPKHPPGTSQPITWELARAVENNIISFAPHGITHTIFSRLSDAVALKELRESHNKLKKELNNPIPIFCFPNGRSELDFSERDISLAKQLGYSAVVSTDSSYLDKHYWSDYIIDRIGFPSTHQELNLIALKLDYFSVIRARFIRNLNYKYGSKKGYLRYCIAKLKYKLGKYKQLQDIHWKLVRRLVFICHGNICRSVYATGIAHKYTIPAISFGLDTSNGKPPHSKVLRLAALNHIDLSTHKTRQIESYTPAKGDLIIGMEEKHLTAFDKKIKTNLPIQKTLLGIWSETSPTPYIHDPYSCEEPYFRKCLARIDDCVIGIKNQLQAQ